MIINNQHSEKELWFGLPSWDYTPHPNNVFPICFTWIQNSWYTVVLSPDLEFTDIPSTSLVLRCMGTLQTSGQSPWIWTDTCIWAEMLSMRHHGGTCMPVSPRIRNRSFDSSLLNPQVSSLQNCHFYLWLTLWGRQCKYPISLRLSTNGLSYIHDRLHWTDLILMVHSGDFLTLFFVGIHHMVVEEKLFIFLAVLSTF